MSSADDTAWKKVEFLENQLDRILNFITSCDTKSSIALTFVSIFIAGTISSGLFWDSMSTGSTSLTKLVYVLPTAFMWSGVVLLLLSLRARLRLDKIGLSSTPKLFFGSIAKIRTLDVFSTTIDETLSVDAIEEELKKEIFTNSKICSKKYLLFNLGLTLSGIGGLMQTLIILFNFTVGKR